MQWIGPPPAGRVTLVFLHDGLGCAGTWRDFPDALAAATGCPALVYSRAGHGRSAPLPPGPLAATFMHEEAIATLPRLLRETGVERAVLVGHSDGGSISLIYGGARETAADREGRLLALIVLAPHLFVEEVCRQSIRGMRERYARGDFAERMARHHGANAGPLFARWTEIWLRDDFQSWNLEEYLPGVRCPVLALQGEDDEFGTLAHVQAIERQAGGPVETHVFPACGHSPQVQQRERTLAAIVSFLNRHGLVPVGETRGGAVA